MNIKSVEISNILSVKSVSLDFAESGLVLLDGWNYDDDTANGAGKTAIFNSICFGLYGKLPRKISASEILREGSKSGYVRVCIETNTSIIEVKRSRPNHLSFSVDGVEKTMTQEEFESLIKLTYTQFLISMYSAQTEGSKLISLNDSGKKDFFLKLMNLDAFDDCKGQIDAALKVLYADKIKNESTVAEISARIETYEESLVDEQAINDELLLINVSDIESAIAKLLLVNKPDVDKFNSLEQKLSDEYRAIQTEENENNANLREILRIEATINRINSTSHPVDCPHCLESFVIGQDAIDKEVADLNEAKNNIQVTDDDFAVKKNKLKDLIIKCRNKRNDQLQEYMEAQESISVLKGELAEKQHQSKTLHSMLATNSVAKQKIALNKVSLKTAMKAISDIDEQILVHESIQSIFSSTGAPAYILDSAISVFNEKVAGYVSMIWPNASYELQSFKTNKTGDIKAKMSEQLIIGGKERSIGALSGGEHRCLSLAVDFAVIDVLEVMFGMSLNPIMLDEAFNDLDASNRERVLEMLEKVSLSRQIWVIDHATEAKSAFSNVVKVEKRNGITSLI